MCKKRVIIHIGPGKTGSSFLQFYLLKNQHLLGAQGFLYPTHRCDKNGISSGHVHLLFDRQGDYLVLSQRKLQKLKTQFSQSNCHTLILSSEKFAKAAELFTYFPNARFVAYFRNPLEVSMSAYIQNVKRAGEALKFKPHINLFMFKHILPSMKYMNLQLRPYYQNHPSWLLHDDFLNVCGIAKKEAFKLTKKNINSAYTFEALEFQRFLNQFTLQKKLLREVDFYLQQHIGTHKYSLVSQPCYQHLQDKMLEELGKAFLGIENISWLDDFIKHITAQKNLPYKEQSENNTHNDVLHFLAKRAPRTLKKIYFAVQSSNKAALATPLFLSEAKTLLGWRSYLPLLLT